MTNNALQRQSWWSRPKALVAFALAFIAGLAGLVTNLKTLIEAIGFGPKGPEITLSVLGPASASPAVPHVYSVPVTVTKTGDGVLHNCSFSAWIGGFQYATTSSMGTFTIPNGAFRESTELEIQLHYPYMIVDDYGDIYLSCDTASSKRYRFLTPP
jgi:hypothetical protein